MRSASGVRARRQIETHRRVTEAAAAVFREVGYEAATMRTIAARAGVATGTLFLHAPEKRSLLIMILNNEMERATDEAFDSMPRHASLLQQFTHIFRIRYKYLGRDPRLSLDSLKQASFLSPASELDPESPAGRYFANFTLLRRRLVELAVEHQRSGHLSRKADPQDVAAIAIALYSTEVRLWLRSERPVVAAGLRVLARRLALALGGALTPSGVRSR